MPLFRNFFKQPSKSNIADASDDISQVEIRTQAPLAKNDQRIVEQNSAENHVGIYMEKMKVDLPMELMINIAQFMDVRQLNGLSLCNSRLLMLFFNVKREKIGEKKKESEDETLDFERVQQLIWKPLVFAYYPKFEKQLNIKNWMHLLRRRLQHVKLHGNNNSVNSDLFKLDIPNFVTSGNDEKMIENCEWIYKCPLNYDQLTCTPESSSIRYCNVCNKNVYKVDSMESFLSNTQKGNCVAFTTQYSILVPPMVVMGSCVQEDEIDFGEIED